MLPDTTLSAGVLRVTQTLRERLEAGSYSPGRWLPAERELAEEFGVHRNVVRGAILRLAQEGHLVCRPRCRPLVAPRATIPSGAPHAAARDGVAGRRLVALIMWHGGFQARVAAQQRIFWGFNRTLARAGHHGIFLDLGEEAGSEEETAAREAARLQYALDYQFAGIVFCPYAGHRGRDLIRDAARRTPLVLIDGQAPGVETDYVGTDNVSAVQEAARHLMAQGHRRIALVTRSGPANTVQDRIAGYRAALRRADPPAPDQVLMVDSAPEWALFDLIFGQSPAERPTALLCGNDLIALRVAERLTARGIHIPGDVTLVGFEGLVQTLPGGAGLTSVAPPFGEIGATAARLVLERIRDRSRPCQRVEVAASLVSWTGS